MKDLFKNDLQVGDVCGKIYNYNTLQIVTVKKLNEEKCTFTDGTQGRYDLVFSLAGIGIQDDGRRHEYGDKTDALGNELHVGDVVLFISSRGAYFHKGVVRSLPTKRVTVEYNGKKYSKGYGDTLSLTAYGKEDFDPPLPGWSTWGDEGQSRDEELEEEMIKEYPFMRNYYRP